MGHHGAATAVGLGALSRPSLPASFAPGWASEIPSPALSVLPRLIRPGVIYAAMLLLLKLTLAPLLVATATLIARRWGPKVAGVLIGFPVLTGPIFVFLVIDQGLDFAERSIVGILFGLVGLAAFALAYALVSRRTGWFGSVAAAGLAFFLVAAGASRLDAGVVQSALAAYAALVAAVLLIKRPRFEAVKTPPPWWDLWVRMAAASGLTMAITGAANWLGPVLAGVIGTYPVITTVVLTFTHHQWSREAAVALLRGILFSWISFASCFLVIGLTLHEYGLAVSFVLGGLAAAVTSGLVLALDRWAQRRSWPETRAPAAPATSPNKITG